MKSATAPTPSFRLASGGTDIVSPSAHGSRAPRLRLASRLGPIAAALLALGANSDASAEGTPAIVEMAAVTVTGTREKALISETPASVATIKPMTIRETSPMHPGQILGQVPGVAVAVTNGEGHTTAIRQPFTTSPVYLFLEDGIPVRATGFFNHNSLYEVNVPMAGGIEVVRGPGTALYGSDAIGGIVNILSAAPSHTPEVVVSAEVGSFDVRRLLASGSLPFAEQGAVRVDLNLTHNGGWRDGTAYDRQSVNARADYVIDENSTLKAIVGTSMIDQETGANSALPFNDYYSNPTRNNFAIAYRKVSAFRTSLEYERKFGDSLLSVTPYFRANSMELNATFTLNSDPRIDKGENLSFGALLKWRKNFAGALRARLISGLDVDYSPGSRKEDNILVTRTGTGANTVFTGYTMGTRIYNYDVTYRSASPYVHTELSPLPKMRVTAGLRYDAFEYDMTNKLAAGSVQANVLGSNRFYGQIASKSVSYSRVSPKLGATYALPGKTHLYASYNHGFRGPSESQLFRAGNDTTEANAIARAQLALALKPIKARQAEFGVRGDVAGWNYNVVVYQLIKKDDLVSQRDLATNLSTSVNAGKTKHEGIEVGAGTALPAKLRLDTAFSFARHRYVDWVTATANFSGKDIEAAPKVMANTRLTWNPLPSTMLQAEWVRIGSYWLEASNSSTFGKYPGHDLLNVRAKYTINKHFAVVGRVMNALDKRFADSSSVSSNTPVFSPGLPRGYYAGIEARW